MPDPELGVNFRRTLEQYELVARALIPLAERMTLEAIGEALPGAHVLELRGERNEDSLPILRIQRVLDAGGAVLFDVEVGHEDRAVEDTVDEVNTEYLDLLLDLTGDEYLGARTLRR